jgi:hypothetical protein
MKTILLSTLLILSACAGSPNANRKIASDDIVLKKDAYHVGEIKISLLTADKFASLYGSVWVLMDGSSQVSSLYSMQTGMNRVPDARGAFLRMHNNGRSDSFQNPDKKELGEFQSDELLSHSHTMSLASAGRNGYSGGPNPTFSVGSTGTSAVGGNETRPKNVTVNYFVKIDNCPQDEVNCL